MSNAFSQFDLHPQIIANVAARDYTEATPIQAALIPKMLEGRDVIGQAQTGTGKTAAFALPLLQRLDPEERNIQGLVVTPTRELALQVAEAIYNYGDDMSIRVLPIYGGQSYGRQIRRLKKGVDVVVGTPGRMLDLIRKGELNLGQVRTAVLDEADEMLSMGFIDDIESILKATPSNRQTAFFSATLPRGIKRLASRHMDNPHSVSLGHEKPTAQTIEQRYYRVKSRDRFNALLRLLEVESVTSAIVFARTRADTFKLADRLSSEGYSAGALNGEMDQPARQKMLARFREGNINILVGTNVAARGLDIDHISHVFNYALPRDPQVYVHRIGRTGRAGKKGTAISLVPGNKQGQLRKIERYTKESIKREELPTEKDLQAHRDDQLIEQLTKQLENDTNFTRERKITKALVKEGYDPMDVVTAALKTARRSKQAASEALQAADQSSSNGSGGDSHSHERGMVRLTLNAGKSNGARPGQIIEAIARIASIPGGVIGKIDIHKRHTLIDIPRNFADQVLARSGNYRIGKRRVDVKRA